MKKILLTSLSILSFSSMYSLTSYANKLDPEINRCPKKPLGMNTWKDLQKGKMIQTTNEKGEKIDLSIIPEDIQNLPSSTQLITWKALANSSPFFEKDDGGRNFTCTYEYKSTISRNNYQIRLSGVLN